MKNFYYLCLASALLLYACIQDGFVGDMMSLLKINENESRNLQLIEKLQCALKKYPFIYNDITIREDSRPAGFLFYPFSLTIAVRYCEHELVVCGEGFTQDEAFAKVISELIERTCMLNETRKNPVLGTTSNGWAAHIGYSCARNAAIFEIIERDAVLAQWYSQTPFLQIHFDTLPQNIQGWASNELSRSEFPLLKVLITTEGLGPSVTVLLMNNHGYGVCGHSTKLDLSAAIENAVGEACRTAQMSLRNLYFEETEKLNLGVSGKTKPVAHGLYYAYQKPFPAWMVGKTVLFSEASDVWCKNLDRVFQLFGWQILMYEVGELFVAKASHPSSLELKWGPTHESSLSNLTAKFRLKLKNNKLNLEPHPIA